MWRSPGVGAAHPRTFFSSPHPEKMSLFPHLYFSDADFTAKGGHVRRLIVRINDCFFPDERVSDIHIH